MEICAVFNPLPGGPLRPPSPAALGPFGPSKNDKICRAATILMTLARFNQTYTVQKLQRGNLIWACLSCMRHIL